MRTSGLALLLSAIAPLLGCSAASSQSQVRAFYSGAVDEARAELRKRADEFDESRALYLNELGTIELLQSALDDAYRDFLEASKIMGSFEGTNLREVGAVVGSESSKIWKGDPYEKAMNSFYLGVINLLHDVNDNALAGFKNAIFVDSGQGEERFDGDFAPAYFLEGISYRRLGDDEMAQRDFAKAHELEPSCTVFGDKIDANVVVVVDVGRGPTKRNAGMHGEATRFVSHTEGPHVVSIRADGAALGRAQKAGDVYFQATTRGGRVFDAVLKGKAIYRTSAEFGGLGLMAVADEVGGKHEGAFFLAGLGLFLSSFFVRSEADVRHWGTLPGEVQLFAARLTPGEHEIEIVPEGPSYGRYPMNHRHKILVPDRGDVVLYDRVLP